MIEETTQQITETPFKTKNLFRISLEKSSDDEGDYHEQTHSFEVSDDALSSHTDVYVLEIPYQRKNPRTFVYSRDLFTEWDNTLFVKAELFQDKSISTPFLGLLDKLNYSKDIRISKYFAEGGCFLVGNEFVLVSDVFEEASDDIESFMKQEMGFPDVPFYCLPSVTSFYRNHIDCDYQIMDKLKLIYFGRNVSRNYKDSLTKLEDIARECNYNIRNYPSVENDERLVLPSGKDYINYDEEKGSCAYEPPAGHPAFAEFIAKRHGINFILSGDNLFTSFIHPDERKYLEENGIKPIEVPLGKMHAGAGLRCMYGEFSLN